MTIEALRGKWILEIFFEKNGTLIRGDNFR